MLFFFSKFGKFVKDNSFSTYLMLSLYARYKVIFCNFRINKTSNIL